MGSPTSVGVGSPTSVGGGGAGAVGGGQAPGGSGAASSSSGATATGTVTAVSKVADASSGVAKYPVTITFNADSNDFYVGATVTGDISTAVRNNVTQVSSSAITTTNGTSTVVVATDGTLNGPTETRTVTTGLTANGMTEITAGLKVGRQGRRVLPRAAQWVHAAVGRRRRWLSAAVRRGLPKPPAGSGRMTAIEEASTSSVIELMDVSKIYATGDIEVAALRDVSLRIDETEFVAIVGPSGSGKSTLMHILGCLDVPTSGVFRLAGHDVQSFDEDRLAAVRNLFIGFVFQQFNLLAYLPAWRNVELPLMYAGMSPAERRERAMVALGQVGLADRADHQPGEMSGGQQQRVAVARALVTEPAMILADEPTGNLDSTSTADVLSLLEDLHDAGRTIVLITHELDIAERAERTIQIRDGRLWQPESTASDLRLDPGRLMSWRDTLRTATEAVRTHRLRSALTMLGILIGITAVVLTVGLGQGAQAQVKDQINELGTNLLVVSPGSTTSSSGSRRGFGSASTLTVQDADALRAKAAAPYSGATKCPFKEMQKGEFFSALFFSPPRYSKPKKPVSEIKKAAEHQRPFCLRLSHYH